MAIKDDNLKYNKSGCLWDLRKSNYSNSAENTTLTNIVYLENNMTGVEFMPKFGKWVVTISKKKRLILVGLFDSFEKACNAFYVADRFKNTEIERLSDTYNEGVNAKYTDYHSRYYQEIDGVKFGLPAWLDTEKRKKFIVDLIEARPDLYTYKLPYNKYDKSSYHVEYRLTILGSYMMEPELDVKNNVILSAYKRHRIRENEIPFCVYYHKFLEI